MQLSVVLLTDSPLVPDNVCVFGYVLLWYELAHFVNMCSIFDLENGACGIKAVFKCTYPCPWQF